MVKKYDTPVLLIAELEITQQMNGGSKPDIEYDWEIEVEGNK